MSAKTTYKAGDVIDVAWCVSADHGGVPQFRLCDDEGLVSAVTTPGYKPTVADHEALEQCFQRGLLRCDGVESNTCDQVAECDTYAADWEACADKGKYLHCVTRRPRNGSLSPRHRRDAVRRLRRRSRRARLQEHGRDVRPRNSCKVQTQNPGVHEGLFAHDPLVPLGHVREQRGLRRVRGHSDHDGRRRGARDA